MHSLIDKITDKLDTVITDISTKINTLNTVISDISTKISDISTKNNTLNTTVTNGFNKGCVKSVQRGTYSSKSYSEEVTINISSINTSNSLVIIDGSDNYGADSATPPLLHSLSSTSITVTANLGRFSKFTWQVIEFY